MYEKYNSALISRFFPILNLGLLELLCVNLNLVGCWTQSARRSRFFASKVIFSFYSTSHQRACVKSLRSFPKLNPNLKPLYLTLRTVLQAVNGSKSEFHVCSVANMSTILYWSWSYIMVLASKIPFDSEVIPTVSTKTLDLTVYNNLINNNTYQHLNKICSLICIKSNGCCMIFNATKLM